MSGSRPGPGRDRGRAGLVAFFLLLTSVLLAAASGCARHGAEDEAVLRVGPRTVTLADFRYAFQNAMKADTTLKADTASVRRFLKKYQDDVLLEVLAQDSIPQLQGTPKGNLEELQEEVLIRGLRDQAYGDASKVTDKELQEAYARDGRKVRLSFIVVQDRNDAEQIVKALAEGAVFAKVAAQKSLDTRSRASGGDIGWIHYTDLDPGIREQVFALKVGEIGGPYPYQDKFEIFKVTDEGVNEKRGPLEKERPLLSMGLNAQRVADARKKYTDGLYRKYHLRLDPVQVAWMTVLLRDKTKNIRRGLSLEEAADPIKAQRTADSEQMPFQGSPVEPADTGRVLATFDPPGGRVTPMLVVDQLLTDPAMAWPTFQSSADVEGVIRTLVLERLENREARARHIDRIPAVARELSQIERDVRRRVFYRTQVRARAHPSDQLCLAYYNAHLKDYVNAERRRFVGMNSASWDNAIKAREMLLAGRSIDDVTKTIAPQDTTYHTTGVKGTDFLTYGQSPLLDRFVFALPLGGVSDPIPVIDRFTVAKVVEITPARQRPFDEVKNDIAATIGGARQDSIVKVILAEGRRSNSTTVNWDVARRVLSPPA